MCSQAVVSSRPDCVTKDPGGFSKSELEPQTSTRGYRLRVREVHKYFRAARGIRVLARLGFPSFEFAQIRVMLLWPHIRLLCLGNIILSQLGQRKTRSQCASDRQIRGLAKQPSKRHSVSTGWARRFGLCSEGLPFDGSSCDRALALVPRGRTAKCLQASLQSKATKIRYWRWRWRSFLKGGFDQRQKTRRRTPKPQTLSNDSDYSLMQNWI